MRSRAPAALLCALIIAASFSALILMTPAADAQPTWSFSIELLPAELYMGEWGTLRANITNTDCSSRSSEPYEVEFDDIPEREFESILERAREMNESRWIKDYDYDIEYAHGFGGQVYYDAKLVIKGACSGTPIKLYYALLWFPWKNYPGREFGFKADANVELKAFNPIDYILEGVSPGSSIILEFRIFIPPDILPEERLLKPVMDLRVHYPRWIDYTLEAYPTHGPFEIQPYRSFNLTVMDYDGVNPIAGARVVIRRLIHYYDVREYVTPENGTIRIHRLREDDYEVRVYWNSSLYLQESSLVHLGHHSAYELASRGIRTMLFNVGVRVLDLRERPLDGARVFLDGVELIAENGSALYELVPNGNHSLQAYWMGVKLLDEWVWVGYHPTISPEIKKPRFDLILPVDDLVVQAVDSGGAPVGANFTVADPWGILPELEAYSRSGILNITQLVVGDYRVRAWNCSQVFKTCAEASGVFRPGSPSKIELPLHSAALRILSRSGVELENASVIFGGVEARAGPDGAISFPGIPEGEYPVKVLWRGVEVYDGRIRVSGSGSWEVVAEVYDLRLELETADGRPLSAWWIFVDSSGHEYVAERPSDTISLKLLPAGPCNLTIVDERNFTLASLLTRVEELAELETLKLPVKDLEIRVSWSDGRPLSGARVVLEGLKGLGGEERTDGRGVASFRLMPYANYSVGIYYPGTSLLLVQRNVTFEGEPVEVVVGRAQIMVKVVDKLGNPLPGASLKLHVSGVVFGELGSGSDGIAIFSDLPYLNAYQLEVVHGPLRVGRVVHPGESLVLELDAVNILGLIIYVHDILALIPYIVGVIAVCATIAGLLVFRASLRRERF